MFQELLLLRRRQELIEARDREQERTRIGVLEAGATQEVGADHLQAIAPRFVSPQHQRGCLYGLLHHRQLALVELEVDELPGLGLLAGEVAVDLALELLFGEFAGLVQPGCTSEDLADGGGPPMSSVGRSPTAEIYSSRLLAGLKGTWMGAIDLPEWIVTCRETGIASW